ncbi:methyltransferase domain-containing protein [Streptomyces sp. NPDC059474]|uniref:methyltransferase domain-containing protein n=1 Tax=unclassified Streptomyces TaxID=2593676 RepID=UPI0033F8BCEA
MVDMRDDPSSVVQGFFERKALAYDENRRGAYGKLVNALQWSALELSVFSRLPDDFSFLDIGGGAGRWTHRMAVQYPRSTGMLWDFTAGMVDLAESRAVRHGYDHRVRFQHADVHDAPALLSGQTFDLIFNSHHLLGFVSNPGTVIASLSRLLSTDGLMASVLPSRWHAAFEGLAAGCGEQAKRSLEGERWATNPAPYQHLFTPGEIRAMHASSNLRVDLLTGFPGLIYPDVDGTRSAGAEPLQDEDQFRQILAMENELLIDPDAGGRGANLFVVASLAVPGIR